MMKYLTMTALETCNVYIYIISPMNQFLFTVPFHCRAAHECATFFGVIPCVKSDRRDTLTMRASFSLEL